MIRAVIIDDEPLARSSLAVLLGRDPSVEVAGEFGSGADAVAGIRALAPDLAFLDVAMPEIDGFDVLEQLGGDVPSAVVFVTAHDAHAVRAFETGAVDYLVKPFDDRRFALTLERAKQRIDAHRRAPACPPSLIVRHAGSVAILALDEIDWIEAAGYTVRVHAGSAEHVVRRSLADLERELDATAFCRIHRSVIVRVARIRRLELNPSGEYDVVLADGARLPLSRRYRRQVQTRLRVRAPNA